MRLSHWISGFSDELQGIVKEKTANMAIGALIGGGLGSIGGKNKIRNGLIGAGIGAIGGGLFSGARKILETSHTGGQFPSPDQDDYTPSWQQHYAG